MNDELAKSLTVLSTKLGTSIEHLWVVLKFQAKVTAIEHLIVFTILIVAAIVALKKGWPLLKADPDNTSWGSDEFDKKMTKGVIVAACVIFGCVFLDGVFDAIVYLINPDYYALQQVIKIVK